MDSIKKKLLESNPNLKSTSVDNYLRNIKLLSNLLNFKKFNIKYLNDYDTVIDFIHSNESFQLATKRNYITSIISILKLYSGSSGNSCKTNNIISKDAINAYYNYHQQLTAIQNEEYSLNLKTKKEELNWITLNDVHNKIKYFESEINKLLKNKLDLKLIDLYQQYLILNLYTLLPPIRNDYAGEMVVYDSELSCSKLDCNRMYLQEKLLILCNYKTSSSYGDKKIDIPDKLIDIIKIWFEIRNRILDSNSRYLLIKLTNPDTFMSKNMLTKTINKIFKPKKVSTTLLRKIYLSEKYPVVNTFNEMQKDAYIMGHDIKTAKLIYSKKL